MKVILLRDVAKVGQRGTVVEVSDGYALNFLIPNSMAEQATVTKVAAHAVEQKKDADAKEMKKRTIITTIKSVENAHVELKVKATEKGGLFKSVTAVDIVKALHDQRRADIPLEAIDLPKPIKEVGEHPITIKASGVEAHITLSIKPA